jgi:3-hydroxybutyryl-CoA dehydrogenase
MELAVRAASPATTTRLGIVGAGTMGSGIALAALYAGQSVILFDVSDAMLERARAYAQKHLARKHKLDAVERFTTSDTLDALKSCDFVVEAVPEDIQLKRRVFSDLQRVCSADCVLATNTSTLSVTGVAAVLEAPERAVGMHFFNPAAVLPLVEVVRAADTSVATIERTLDVARRLDKTPVVVRDSPGFVVNRVARPFYGEALKLLGEGAADVQTLDWILQFGAGFRMGPFRLMDLIGIDVNLAAMRSVYEQTFGEPRYRPHPIQKQKVLQENLGRKSGRGFYVYGEHEDQAEPDFPAVGAAVDSVFLSPGSWAPGMRAELDEAGMLSLDAQSADAGLVAAGRHEDLPERLAALDAKLPADRPLFCQTADVTAHEACQWVTHSERLIGVDGWFLASGRVATLARGPATDPVACSRGESIMAALGKLPLWVDDPPGMVAPRMLAMLVNEAAFAVGEGVAPEETVDEAMVLGVNYPHGPIEWGRSLGLDRILAVLEHLQKEFGEDRYRPAPWLRRQVRIESLQKREA